VPKKDHMWENSWYHSYSRIRT